MSRSSLPHRTVTGLLRGGLILSTLLFAAGLVQALREHRLALDPVRPSQLLAPLPVSLHLLEWAVVVLLLTPLLRVGALGILWLIEGDRRFAAVAFTVGSVLVAAVLLGGG